jgi:hypothetical protein
MFPTQFTPEQLERMRDLARKEESRDPTDRELHNLAYKLDDYARNARAAQSARARQITSN